MGEMETLYPKEEKITTSTGHELTIRPLKLEESTAVLAKLAGALMGVKLPEGINLESLKSGKWESYLPLLPLLMEGTPELLTEAFRIATSCPDVNIGKLDTTEAINLCGKILMVNVGIKEAVKNFKNLVQGKP